MERASASASSPPISIRFQPSAGFWISPPAGRAMGCGEGAAERRAPARDPADPAREREDLRLPADPCGVAGDGRAGGAPDTEDGCRGRDTQALQRLDDEERGRPEHGPLRTPSTAVFSTDGPDRLWIAEITHVSACADGLQLAAVVEVWRRRVPGRCIRRTAEPAHTPPRSDPFRGARGASSRDGVSGRPR